MFKKPPSIYQTLQVMDFNQSINLFDVMKQYLMRHPVHLFSCITVYTRLYMDSLYYVVSFVLPLLLLAMFNAKLILAYRQFRKRRRILRPTHLNARLVGPPVYMYLTDVE